MTWKVYIIESERNWGQKVDETHTFDDYDAAIAFRDKENAKNNEACVPDIYWYATDPVKV